MKFLSVKEYFYKLNTIGFIVLLLPMGVFAFLYSRALNTWPPMADRNGVITNLIAVGIIVAADLTIVHLWWIFKMNRLRALIEISRKMDGYFSMMVTKMIVYCMTCLVCAGGYYFSGSEWFSGLFVMLELALILQWPSRKSFCAQLSLRNDEKAMIMQNVDFYQKR